MTEELRCAPDEVLSYTVAEVTYYTNQRRQKLMQDRARLAQLLNWDVTLGCPWDNIHKKYWN